MIQGDQEEYNEVIVDSYLKNEESALKKMKK